MSGFRKRRKLRMTSSKSVHSSSAPTLWSEFPLISRNFLVTQGGLDSPAINGLLLPSRQQSLLPLPFMGVSKESQYLEYSFSLIIGMAVIYGRRF